MLLVLLLAVPFLSSCLDLSTGVRFSNNSPGSTNPTIPPTPLPPTESTCKLNEIANKDVQRLSIDEYRYSVETATGHTPLALQIFPPEASQHGFNNNANIIGVDAERFEVFWQMAEESAEALSKNSSLNPCLTNKTPECVQSFLTMLAQNLLRKIDVSSNVNKITSEIFDIVNIQSGYDDAFKASLLSLLISPEFIYKVERYNGSQISQEAQINRISFFLTGKHPDHLSMWSAQNISNSNDPMTAQVERLLSEEKNIEKLVDNFFMQWLGLRKISTLNRSNLGGDEDLLKDMLSETRRFMISAVKNNLPLKNLFDHPERTVNKRLANHYGLSHSGTNDDWERYQSPAGILRHASIMTITGSPFDTDPVNRGIWVLDSLLCSKPPDPEVSLTNTDNGPTDYSKSKRERIETIRSAPTCIGCHVTIDPIGFAFENYDSLGRWRTKINDFNIDASGTYENTPFNDVDGLINIIKNHKNLPGCFVGKMVTYILGRELSSEEVCVVSDIVKSNKENNYPLKDLIKSISLSPIMRY